MGRCSNINYLESAMYDAPDVDLSVNLCGISFKNPFILAAAPPTDDLDMVRAAYRAGWAGAVLKTTSVEGTAVPLAYPMMSGCDHEGRRLMGMGNIDLISEHHIDVVEARCRTLKEEFPDCRTIISISGQSKESWQECARRARAAGCDLIECSFSCPQGSLGLKPGAMLGQDVKASKEVASWIKEAAKSVPVIIKLTPQVADIAEIVQAIKDGGADAVCLGNTMPSLMGIDPNSFAPIPDCGGKSTYSGLSGPAVKPISLRAIAIAAKETGIDIAGSGGVITWQDALEFILVGANVVEFCTAVMHYGSNIITDLIEGLAFHLESKGIASIHELRGRSLPSIVSHDELPRLKWRPLIEKSGCTRCNLCLIACHDGGHRAIAMDEKRYPKIDDTKCVGCALCSTMCPTHCITMEKGDS